jgi:hypothetical protein
MNTPSFTAENALSNTCGRYYTAVYTSGRDGVTGPASDWSSPQVVLPALSIYGHPCGPVPLGPCKGCGQEIINLCTGAVSYQVCNCPIGGAIAPNACCGWRADIGGGKCTNLSNDPQNCGSCFHACSPGQCCSGYSCGTLCSDGCVHVETDPNNCGACGNVCPEGMTCGNLAQSGACTGLVSDSNLLPGDVLIFVPTDATGAVIDLATGLYGYSHTGMVGTGSIMFDVDNTNDPTVPQVEMVDLSTSLQRGHVGVRFPLRPDQVSALGPCLMSQVGEGMDWLQLVTFGAINQPGTELCTTLITHCLDQVGFNRAAMGLGGFVSPNDFARAFNAPKGKPFGIF